MVVLGPVLKAIGASKATEIACEDEAFCGHLRQPYLRRAIEREIGMPVIEPERRVSRRAVLEDWLWHRHAAFIGPPGVGKTMAIRLCFLQLLARLNASAIFIDPKLSSLEAIAQAACHMGLPAERVTFLAPKLGYLPRWSPLSASFPAQSARQFVDVLEKGHPTSWGPRLRECLMNASIIVAAQGLSIYELVRFLTIDNYRMSLLRQPAPSVDRAAYMEAVSYFITEFNLWSKPMRVDAVAAVTNKCREILRNEDLSSLYCAESDTRLPQLALERLWQEPRLLLVHMNEDAFGLEGTRQLAGLLCAQAFSTAMRVGFDAPLRVYLFLDELGLQKYVAESLCEILAVARSQQLHLVLACQSLSQLPPQLASALVTMCALQVVFRADPDTAASIARSVFFGKPRSAQRVVIEAETDNAGEIVRDEVRLRVLGPEGQPVQVSAAWWGSMARRLSRRGLDLTLLQPLASYSGIPRLYVKPDPKMPPVALEAFLASIPISDYRLEGPALVVIVSYPRPNAVKVHSSSERDATGALLQTLQTLPNQTAFVRAAGKPLGIVKIGDVKEEALTLRQHDYIQAALEANGQPPQEAEGVLLRRAAEVERISRGLSRSATVEDGSLE